MIIDKLTLRKICLEAAFVDTELLKSYISQSTMKRIQKFIRNLKAQYADQPSMAESEIVKEFQANFLTPNGKKYLKILLPEAFEADLISGATYDELRKQLIGFAEYDDNTRQKLEEKWKREYKTDPFSMLQGNSNNALSA